MSALCKFMHGAAKVCWAPFPPRAQHQHSRCQLWLRLCFGGHAGVYGEGLGVTDQQDIFSPDKARAFNPFLCARTDNLKARENWPICGLEPQKALLLDTAVIGAQKIRCSLVGILGLALWPVCCLFRRSGLHVQQHLEIRRKQPNLMRRSVHFGRCSRSSAASVLCMRSPTLLTAVELNHYAPCNHLRLMFD